ncbi:MAG TPA: rod shape-determining protein MreC [Thermoleophilaceae bacterium]
MFDKKVVRRRRAALAVFVGLSVVLLTAYFGESGGGALHSVQRGTQEALAPVETGASRALKPVKDFFGWVGDSVDAKKQNKELKADVERLRSELAKAQTAQRDARELRGLVGLQRTEGYPRGTKPVTARIIARSPTVWYSSVKIDKGSDDGVKLDQPVVASGGLAGKITSVSGGTSEVTLITDGSSFVAAQIVPKGAHGVIAPSVGNPNDLLLQNIEDGRRVTAHTTVVTSGFTTPKVRSLFPRGIPIGEVSKVDLDEVATYHRVHVKPFADLRSMDYVQVLTARGTTTVAEAGAP